MFVRDCMYYIKNVFPLFQKNLLNIYINYTVSNEKKSFPNSSTES